MADRSTEDRVVELLTAFKEVGLQPKLGLVSQYDGEIKLEFTPKQADAAIDALKQLKELRVTDELLKNQRGYRG